MGRKSVHILDQLPGHLIQIALVSGRTRLAVDETIVSLEPAHRLFGVAPVSISWRRLAVPEVAAARPRGREIVELVSPSGAFFDVPVEGRYVVVIVRRVLRIPGRIRALHVVQDDVVNWAVAAEPTVTARALPHDLAPKSFRSEYLVADDSQGGADVGT